MLYGIDCSQFQGQIDWDALNAAANFAIIRATYGTLTDTQFTRNQAEARRVRASSGPLGIGYYHFAYPTLLTPSQSANYFLNTLGALQVGEILVLDLEGNIGANPVSWAIGFMQVIEAHTGVKPLIYLNQSLMNGYDWSPLIGNGNGLWVADYDGNKTSMPPMGKWPVVAMKQWTDVDIVNGTPAKVDGDTFYGDFPAFYAYGFDAPVPTPPASPPAAGTSTPPPIPSPPPIQPSPPIQIPTTPAPASIPPPVVNKGTNPLNQYYKAIVSAVGAFVVWGSTYYSGSNHWWQLVLGLLTAAGVYTVKNDTLL